VFAEAERHEQEVVDPDPDQNRADQRGQRRVDLVTKRGGREGDEPTGAGGDDADGEQWDDRGQHTAEEQETEEGRDLGARALRREGLV
jgi:hypothetical protein